jgi:hypothetical protein
LAKLSSKKSYALKEAGARFRKIHKAEGRLNEELAEKTRLQEQVKELKMNNFKLQEEVESMKKHNMDLQESLKEEKKSHQGKSSIRSSNLLVASSLS